MNPISTHLRYRRYRHISICRYIYNISYITISYIDATNWDECTQDRESWKCFVTAIKLLMSRRLREKQERFKKGGNAGNGTGGQYELKIKL